jgi:SpoVK/Ycf46/Vps4 family AAA+-type ATPase
MLSSHGAACGSRSIGFQIGLSRRVALVAPSVAARARVDRRTVLTNRARAASRLQNGNLRALEQVRSERFGPLRRIAAPPKRARATPSRNRCNAGSARRPAKQPPNLLFLAASNFSQAVDAAFASRCDLVVQIPLPDHEACAHILKDGLTGLSKTDPPREVGDWLGL